MSTFVCAYCEGTGWYLDHKDRARRCACPPHLQKPAPEGDNQSERKTR